MIHGTTRGITDHGGITLLSIVLSAGDGALAGADSTPVIMTHGTALGMVVIMDIITIIIIITRAIM